MKAFFFALISAAMLMPSVAAAAKSIEIQEEDNCRKVFGIVSLEPDPQCTVADKFGEPPYFLKQSGTCFTVKMKGMIKGKGYSGLTAEDTGQGQTPVLLFEAGRDLMPGAYMGESRQLMTARSHLEIAGGDTLQTADVIVVSAETVTEQLVITSGSGAYEGATGNILIDGNTIGERAPYFGNICLPE